MFVQYIFSVWDGTKKPGIKCSVPTGLNKHYFFLLFIPKVRRTLTLFFPHFCRSPIHPNIHILLSKGAWSFNWAVTLSILYISYFTENLQTPSYSHIAEIEAWIDPQVLQSASMDHQNFGGFGPIISWLWIQNLFLVLCLQGR